MDSEEVRVIQSPTPEEFDVIQTRAAQQITAYCHTLQHQLEPPVMHVRWWVTNVYPRPDAPYFLKVNMGPLGSREFPFTRDQIEGYLTGTSKDSVQDRIRTGLKAHLQG